MIISWYGRPIEVMQHNGHTIEFCRWDNGARLYSVDGIGYNQLKNFEFSYFLTVVLKALEA